MNQRKRVFIHSPPMEDLSYPPGCPFKIESVGLLHDRLAALRLLDGDSRVVVTPRAASRAELERFHRPNYLDELELGAAGQLNSSGRQMGLGRLDTPIFRDMFEYGRRACGATLTAAELILSGAAPYAFNPAGGLHHAGAARAAGFCYLNDVVLGCLRLTERGRRVLCLDLNAQHGDGVELAFYHRADVMTISLHESAGSSSTHTGYTADIGHDAGAGYNVNVPLPAGTDDSAYLTAFHQVVMPLMRVYNADVIVLVLGMNALAGDPHSSLCLTNNAQPEIIRRLLRFNRPLLLIGGGGYHIENTVRGWTRAWLALCGEEDDYHLSVGPGGVKAPGAPGRGSLADDERPAAPHQRAAVDAAITTTIHDVIEHIFPFHGLATH